MYLFQNCGHRAKIQLFPLKVKTISNHGEERRKLCVHKPNTNPNYCTDILISKPHWVGQLILTLPVLTPTPCNVHPFSNTHLHIRPTLFTHLPLCTTLISPTAQKTSLTTLVLYNNLFVQPPFSNTLCIQLPLVVNWGVHKRGWTNGKMCKWSRSLHIAMNP